MAFSTAQEVYTESLVNTMYANGFKNYIAYTHTSINTGYNYTAQPDLYILFSDKEIKAISGYTYELEGNCKLYTIRTANYSTSSYAVNTDRVVVSDYTQQVLHIDMYEHIYTNAVYEGYSVQPDIRFKEGGAVYETTNGTGLIVTLALLVAVAFAIFRFK